MKNLKFLFTRLLLIVLFCGTSLSAPYFSYSGPTMVTIPYGQPSIPATYSFSYYNMEVLWYPCLVVSLDGNVISNTLCNNPSTPSSFTISFTPGSHSVQFSLLSVDGQSLDCLDPLIWQTTSFTVTAKFKVREENIFPGGTIYVDNLTTPKTAPNDRTSFTGDNFQIGAIDQPSGGYNWIWNTSGTNNSKWEKFYLNNPVAYFVSDIRNSNYSVQSNNNSTTLRAGLRKICLMDFQNSFIGVGNGGVINVNSVQYSSPKLDYPVTELNPVTSSSIYQVINGITYTFTQWNDGVTTVNRTFYPVTNTTYTANYSGKPNNSYRNLHFSTPVAGQHITFYWNEHPNTNITKYQIWRKVKHNGVVGNPQLLATKNRGASLTYVDNNYVYTSGYTDDLIWYDVRAYYVTENSYADADWLAVFGEEITKRQDSTFAQAKNQEFGVDCFPNPFNPSTNIRVTMPSDGFLQVVIYSVLGEEILQLKNEMVSKGNYNLIWDGKDSGFNQVNSGIYIVMIKTEDKMISQKIVLLK